MDKKYLIPLAIGVGVLVLGLIAAVLFYSGNVEGSGCYKGSGRRARRRGRGVERRARGAPGRG
jgi:hypothetical protein